MGAVYIRGMTHRRVQGEGSQEGRRCSLCLQVAAGGCFTYCFPGLSPFFFKIIDSEQFHTYMS